MSMRGDVERERSAAEKPRRARRALLTIFGVCDLITFLRFWSLSSAILYVQDAVLIGRPQSSMLPWEQNFDAQVLLLSVMSFLRPLVMLSFLASGMLFLLQRRAAFWLSYCHAPFRVAYVLPSLGFLTYVFYIIPGGDYYSHVMVGLLLLDAVRLAVMIVFHRRLYREARGKLQGFPVASSA